jgi:hypothetical protein
MKPHHLRIRQRWGAGAGARIRRAVALLTSTLREIFDESAYSRFLQRHGRSASRDSYAAFRRELESAKARHPRCC